MCKGAGEYRKSEAFTALKHIALPILQDMARVRPWIIVDEPIGKIVFHEGPGIPEDDEELLELLRLSGKIATYMKKRNWLVSM